MIVREVIENSENINSASLQFMKKTFATLIFCFFFFAISAFAQEARKIDEFGNESCDNFRNLLDIFFAELKDSKDAKGYIFVYEGKLLVPLYNKENRTIYPQRGEAEAEIKLIRQHILFRDFDKSRIVLINGGIRERYTVELWIVPNNSTPPKSAPTLKKMKYRKGKAKDRCYYI